MSSTGRTNVKKNCGTAYMVTAIVSFVLTVVSIFLYKYVPVSDIANGIEHSAKAGLIFLAFSPISALVAFVTYLVGGLTDKALVKNSVVQLVIFIISAVMLFLITCISAYLFFTQYKLGFVAPLDGTGLQTLGNINIIAGVLFTVGNSYIFATARM